MDEPYILNFEVFMMKLKDFINLSYEISPQFYTVGSRCENVKKHANYLYEINKKAIS